MSKMGLTPVALFFLSCLTLVFSYSNGPPTDRCSNLLPGHPASTGGADPGGFYIYSDLIDCNGAYNASQAYTIRLQGSQNFKGFIIQARESGTSNLIGTFSSLPSGTQLLGCGGSATVSHNNGNSKSSITVTWTAPASTGTLDIRYTVVVSRSPSIFYDNMAAASFRPSGSSCTLTSPAASSSAASSSVTSSSVAPTSTPAPSSSTQGMPSSSSTPPTSSSISPTSSSAPPPSSSTPPSSSSSSVQPTNLPPACPSTDKSPSSNFPIVFKSPTNCDRASCTFYWAMGPNSGSSQYLDVYMEGTVDGWMAVGFSLDQSMGMDDVLGCKIENNAVTVLDAWNPNGRSPNQADSNSSAGICTHSTSYTNGRMSCLFSRSAGITNQGQDYNLDSSYYILRAYRTDSQPVVSFLYKHSSTPTPSSVQYNPMRDSNTSPSCPTAPTDTSAFPIVFKSPTNCERASCTFYWAMGPNSGSSQYLDVYMEGTVDGWMAVGFSRDQSMGMDDVLGCKIENNAVTVLDAWNPNGYTPNQADSNSSAGLCTHSTSYTNGRMSCLFSRSAGITNQGQDYNLDSSYYILRAFRTDSQPVVDFLYKHSSTPTPSSVQYNPMRDSNTSPSCPSAPTDTSAFPIVFKSPTDCDRASCTFYWAMGPNSGSSQYLDVYMEGTVDGWMAVGFSLDQSMGMDDVLGCKIENNAVTVLDAWNPNGYTPNQADSNSSAGICTHSTSYTNGRMSCLFSRTVSITNQGQDYNLDSSYYILRAYRTNSQPVVSFLYKHSSTPTPSSVQYNPMRDSTTPAPPTEGCPRAPSSGATYPFRVGNPGDDYYFAARFNSENSSFIDMRLEGKADGWIGVGFTETRDMYNADVVGCKRDPADGSVSVVDTWNPSTRSNLLDASQSGICRHTAEYSNGRISCTFSKYVGVIDSGQDLDLNGTLYRIYNAYSSTGGSASEGLSRHDITPSFSEAQTNLLTDIEEGRTETVDTWPKQQLLKTHGTFMTIAWLALAMSGAFFAAWMKPVLPNGEWFIAHRIFMVGSLIVGVLGFILPFIAHARSPTPGLISFSSDGKNTAHFVIGLIIMCLHIANPIIAIFRCNPKGEKRWIFNLSHAHIIGYALLVLSFINIALGAHLLDRGSFVVAGFYIVFIILLTLFQVFLFVIHAYNAHKAPEQDRPALVHSLLKYKYLFATSTSGEYEMKDKKKEEEDKKDTVKPEKKKPLPSALIRTSWIAVIGHLVAVGIAVLIMIILIAIA